jgi:fructose-specific phosphotransferase system IIC component
MNVPDTAEAIHKAASAATYGGSTAAFIGGLTANEFAAVGGLIIGVAGFCVNWYYRYKQDRREEKKRELAE